jgi:hypothetical protein
MSDPIGIVMKDDGVIGSRIPTPDRTEVLLSPIGGGCGMEIPYHKDNDLKSIKFGKIWCGMQSSAMPGLFFTCPECMLREE